MIAEKHKAENRGLDGLGLEIRRRYHERTVVHRKQHHAGAYDLAQRAKQQPRPESSCRPWHVVAGDRDYHRKEDDRERKAEQEADIGRAPGAEWPRQRPLHRIARDLAKRSDEGEGNPERGDGKHGAPAKGRPPCRAQRMRSTARNACDTNPIVVPANAGTHTPRPPVRGRAGNRLFSISTSVVMGPCVRRDDPRKGLWLTRAAALNQQIAEITPFEILALD